MRAQVTAEGADAHADCNDRAEAPSRARQLVDATRTLAQQLLSRLIPREHEVLALVLAGRRNKQIAAELSSREATVKVHRCRPMRKLEARSLAELLRLAGHLDAPGANAADALAPGPRPSIRLPHATAAIDAALHLGVGAGRLRNADHLCTVGECAAGSV